MEPVAYWFDSDLPSARTRSLTLWSSGELTYSERATPADVWGPPRTIQAHVRNGRRVRPFAPWSARDAQGYADTLGLARYLTPLERKRGAKVPPIEGKRPQPFTDDDGVELVTAEGRLTLAGAERLLGEERV